MKLLLILITAVAMSTACTNAVDDAVAAYAKGDYATAVKILRPLAEQGRASAQFNLGQMFRQGHGVVQDYTESLKWYKLAAEQGHEIAQYNLGVMYENGQGVTRDSAESIKWYKLAADQGLTPAKAKLLSWSPAVAPPPSKDTDVSILVVPTASTPKVLEDELSPLLTAPTARDLPPADHQSDQAASDVSIENKNQNESQLCKTISPISEATCQIGPR